MLLAANWIAQKKAARGDKAVALAIYGSRRMSDLMSLELNKEQREVLLQGLRYVRSSIMLNVEEPTPSYVAERNTRLREVSDLSNLLNGRPVAEKATVG